MSRAKYPFKESDIARAFRAARKAGVDVKVEVDLDRRCMCIIPVKVEQTSSNDLDRWVAKHAGEAEGH